jgi:hypothetical protein
MPMPEAAFRTCPDLYLCSLAGLYGIIASTPHPLSSWRVHGQNNTWKLDFLPRVDRYVTLWDQTCHHLEQHARKLGLTPHPDQWLRESWWHRLASASRELCRLIPQEATVLLIDGDEWSCGDLAGRQVLPLIEHNGQSWGAPCSDEHALEELERHRRNRVRYLAVAWQAFWWLDHYTQFNRYLSTSARCLLKNKDLLVFELAEAAHA